MQVVTFGLVSPGTKPLLIIIPYLDPSLTMPVLFMTITIVSHSDIPHFETIDIDRGFSAQAPCSWHSIGTAKWSQFVGDGDVTSNGLLRMW